MLQNRVALVTGGGRGIGRAIAVALAREGADVVLSYHEREADAARTAGDITALGRRALVLRADFSTRGAAAALARQAADAFGGVDILINNAGIIRPQPIEAITESDLDELIAVNLTSVFLLTQAVVAGMRERHWGRIINIASVAAQLGGVVGPHYAASKAGLFGLTHSYAALLAREGVTVNTIAPALIETEMVTSNPRARRDLLPVGRFGSVDEVAGVAVMLAANGYITGQTLNVNGGWYMS